MLKAISLMEESIQMLRDEMAVLKRAGVVT
jgi:hypothetical protein